MRNITGGVARGTDFFGRSAEIAELVHLVERDHVLLLAPRRSGKTSLMYRLQDHPPPGWSVVYLDVEAADSEASFVGRLLAAVHATRPPGATWQRLSANLGSVLERVGKVGAGPVEVELATRIGSDWQEVGTSLFRALGSVTTPTLLLIDEFPVFVQRMLDSGDARVRLLLDWFRALRLGEEVSRAGTRFVLAGSIGLDGVVGRARMSATINDLATFRLGPLARDEARRMLAALAEGERLPLTDQLADRFLERVDWAVPFHLQLLFSEVLRAHRFRGEPLDEALVDRGFEALLGPDKRKHFAHWVERLDVERPAEQDLARRVLAAAARDRRGVGPAALAQLRLAHGLEEEDLAALLQTLEHDGYLVRSGERWRFASSLLRHWWRRWQVVG